MQASIDYPYCQGLSIGPGPINPKKDHETVQLVPVIRGMVNIHFDNESKSGNFPGEGGESRNQHLKNWKQGLFQN